jgi:hypothetical protein
LYAHVFVVVVVVVVVFVFAVIFVVAALVTGYYLWNNIKFPKLKAVFLQHNTELYLHDIFVINLM